MSNQPSLTPLKMLLFAFHATNTIILSYLPLYLKYKGLDGTEIGYVLAVGPLASIVAQPFWGYMSDKYKTVKRVIQVCLIGLLVMSVIFFQMNTLLPILIVGAIFYFFVTPIGALGDSLAQRRAHDLGVSFGTIRLWGSIGFATSSLVIGEILTRAGIQYMIIPYLFFGVLAFIVSFKLVDVNVTSEPVKLRDVSLLIKSKPFLIFLFFIMFLSVTHRANDSFIGLYIEQLGGSEGLVGVAWFVGVLTEALVFATAGYWFRKYHPLVFVIIAGILYSIRWFIYGAADNPWHIISLQFMHGLTFGTFYLASFNYISRLVPKILQSTGHLVFFATFFGVSGIIGSLIGGAMIDTFSGNALYNFMGIIAFIGTILITIYHLLPYGKETYIHDKA
ncbi:MFS transporter [Virgibacillus dokdonensis]|uniref:MFS transporter, PPP family, 3-phenylpropionic acid transporter n=2 Tax=Virgibacillus TaxID=84406 RepID=A0A1M5WGA0_9BACI|nr:MULTISPECIES: MFS transporter [Virgibacillus]RFA34172.1 MFS transporter [Virgibacillus dokdonensis]SHH86457.1 MFS transporter, PPP family, 3-phenylpropionic acid transporter [Virgibacillus chiguensis]